MVHHGRPQVRLHSCEGRSPSLVLAQIRRIEFAGTSLRSLATWPKRPSLRLRTMYETSNRPEDDGSYEKLKSRLQIRLPWNLARMFSTENLTLAIARLRFKISSPNLAIRLRDLGTKRSLLEKFKMAAWRRFALSGCFFSSYYYYIKAMF